MKSGIICPGHLVENVGSVMFVRVRGCFSFSSKETDPIEQQPKVRTLESGARSTFIAIPNRSGIGTTLTIVVMGSAVSYSVDLKIALVVALLNAS